MKKINILLCLMAWNVIKAQNDTSKFPFKSATLLSPKCINNYSIHSMSFDSIFLDKIHENKSKINFNTTYPKVYFTNKNKKEYLEIYSGPDIGFGQFYCIGYTKDSSCDYCGNYLGDMKFADFYVDSSIHLGDKIEKIANKLQLSLFRAFTHQNITYYYYEGAYLPYYIPPVPDGIVFYKFRDDTLFEIGFGYGFTGVNPMFQSK